MHHSMDTCLHCVLLRASLERQRIKLIDGKSSFQNSLKEDVPQEIDCRDKRRQKFDEYLLVKESYEIAFVWCTCEGDLPS